MQILYIIHIFIVFGIYSYFDLQISIILNGLNMSRNFILFILLLNFLAINIIQYYLAINLVGNRMKLEIHS